MHTHMPYRAKLLPAFCAVLAFLSIVGSPPAQDKPLVSEERKQAEKVFKDVYGKDFDRLLKATSGEDKIALVKKMTSAAGEVAKEDPELALLLREKGIELASTDPAGYPLALELLAVVGAEAPEKRPILEQTVALHEKIYASERAAGRPKAAENLVAVYRELVALQIAERQHEAALKTLSRAKTIANYYLKAERELLADLDRQAATVAREQKILARLEVAQKTLKDKPDDPTASTVVGLHYLLLEERSTDAAALLGRSEDAAVRKVSEVLTKAAPSDLELADAYRGAANAAVVGEFKTLLQSRAVQHYKAVIEQDPKHPEATRIKLVISQYGDSVAAEGIKPLSIYAKLQTAIRGGKTTDSRQMGGGNTPFRDVPDGALLVGLEVSFNESGTVKSVRAIFLSERGQLLGALRGFPSNKVVRVVAKPGYAVGALTVKAGLGVDGLSVTFMEIQGDALNPDKSYKTDWLGGRGGGGETRLAGDGSPVVGIFGKTSGEKVPRISLHGLGLVTVPKQK